MQRTAAAPPESSAESTGRRWISRLQRNQAGVLCGRTARGCRGRDAQPVDPAAGDRQQAGSRVSAAIIVISTAKAAAIADAIEEAEAEQQHPHQGDDHRHPGEEHRATGGVDGGDPASRDSMPSSRPLRKRVRMKRA
jgi:hypothetical protein